jgi:mono/diheme cytochrome c family protein
MSGLMLRWRTILGTCIAAYGVLILGGLVFIYSGAYNVAATDQHWPLTYRLFETARLQSIKTRAAEITPPADLDDPSKIVMGTNHFAAHCAVCHSAPGVPKGDIAHGLYPQPPDLAVTAKQYTDAELFWIIKHGIKMTGMPAWAEHGDDENWGTVAFVKKLPGMTPEEYGKLVMQAMQHGGQHGPADADKSDGHMHKGAEPMQPTQQHDHGPAQSTPPSGK